MQTLELPHWKLPLPQGPSERHQSETNGLISRILPLELALKDV